ncbi:MAG: hypothetical protein ACK4VI_05875 [Alphaproteobacteria bacterium]
MSASLAFSQISYFTPQRIVENSLRECLEGKTVKGTADLRAGKHLEDIANALAVKLYGDEKRGIVADSSLQNDLHQHIAIMELAAIRRAAATGCPVVQTRAFRDILDYGSLSSAEMHKARSPELVQGEVIQIFPDL